MNEWKLVQEALAGLPRPTPTPRLRRAVMAQVLVEARIEAAASQVRTWSRAETNGWTTEHWAGVGLPEAGAALPTPARVTTTHRHQEKAGSTAIYQFIQTG